MRTGHGKLKLGEHCTQAALVRIPFGGLLSSIGPSESSQLAFEEVTELFQCRNIYATRVKKPFHLVMQ